MILHFIICIYVFQSSLSSPILYDSGGEHFFLFVKQSPFFSLCPFNAYEEVLLEERKCIF